MGKLTPQGKEIENFDKVFEMKLRYFENTATFVQKFKITDASYQIEGYYWNMVHVMTKTAYHRQKYRSPSREKGMPLPLQLQHRKPKLKQ